MSVAERMRRYRERQRAGKACYRVQADDVEVEECLIEAGLLDEGDRDDRAAVERALSELIVRVTRNATLDDDQLDSPDD